MDNVSIVIGIFLEGDSFLVERHRWDEEIDPSILALLRDMLKPVRV